MPRGLRHTRPLGPWVACVALIAVTTPATAADAPPPRAPFTRGQPLLWRVERGGATSHLFGTCHLPLDLEKTLGRDGLAALDAAKRVFLEIDMSSLMTLIDVFKTTMTRAQMPDRSLRGLLAPPLWDRLVSVHKGQLDAETLDHLKPWSAAFATYARQAEAARVRPRRRAGLDPKKPILDMAVALRAKERDIRIEGLETPLEHIQVFNAQRLEEGLRLLTDVLENPEASDESERILDACIAFDERVMRKEAARLVRRFPDLGDRLLGQRNRAWIERLRLWLPDGDMFVAVGAAHMYGDDGLVALLTEHGYRVTRIRTE